ncbi:hypothetical protein [Ammoniphilus sp. 3BR4]|uniref:hypothetical protein n=1 Tax=Ammoniphilus sp. 3BR4 TaxID=3158265 RepID=UPI00346563F6
MLNKLLPKTPLGFAITAATVLLSVSPEARQFTRKMAVKGIGAVLGAADGIKELTAGARSQMAGLVAEARSEEPKEVSPLTFDMDLEPEPFFESAQDQPLPFNVMSDQSIQEKMQNPNPHH